MNVVFAGTPDFAAAALRSLHAAGHDIRLVLTQPDRPAGRGLRETASAVKRAAQSLGLPVAQPRTLRDPAVVAMLASQNADVMVVAAYGLILPREVLALPRRGCLNIHASLLPRWRGAAPIQRALISGEAQTGISIMQMDEGLDTGPVLLREATPIGPHDTAASLHDRLQAIGARLIVRALAEPHEPEPQDDAAATYAAKIDKREAQIDWRESAAAIDRKVRAFNPVPGAATLHDGQPLKVWAAEIAAGSAADIAAEPGTVAAADARGVLVACGAGALRVTELQRAGGKRLPAAAFLAGTPIGAGARLGA